MFILAYLLIIFKVKNKVLLKFEEPIFYNLYKLVIKIFYGNGWTHGSSNEY